MTAKRKHPNFLLIVGDAFAIFIVVFIGLRFHQSSAERLNFTLLPFLIAWTLVAYALDLFRPLKWNELWRILPAALIAATIGAVLRAGSAVVPIFILVMTLALSVGILVWRALYILATSRSKR